MAQPQTHPACDVKGCNHWKTGLSANFKKLDFLIPFKKQVWTCLKDNGLDSMQHLPGARNEMSRVICDHSCCALDSAGVASEAQALQHDKHDFTNDAAAVAFLLDLLTPALAEITSKKMEEMDSLRVAWLELINKIQVHADRQAHQIHQEQHQELQASAAPRAGHEEMAIVFCGEASELQNAGQCEHNLTLAMLKARLLADGGTNNKVCRRALWHEE